MDGFLSSSLVKVTIFMFVILSLVAYFLPFVKLQRYFWMASIITFLFGDSITTGLLQKYDLEEGGPVTRRICGAKPSMGCSFLTRGLIFIVLIGVYIVLLRLSVMLQYPELHWVAFSLPVMLASGGFFATIYNSHGILKSANYI